MATDQPTPPQRRLKPGTLASVVGLATAGLLLIGVPAEESGRRVRVDFEVNGVSHVEHVSGPQYLQAYLDVAGIATACDGLTKGVRLGQRYTEAQCGQMLERALVEHANGVMACTPGLSLNYPQRNFARFAAVSLAYNIGVSAYCKSTARRQFNAGNIRAACDAFLPWDKARVRGVLRPVRGLTERRKRERAACLKDAA